jgi:hypothetical protein
VHYFPSEYFRYNIAEKDLERPPDAEQEPGYDVNEAVKGILGTAQKPRALSRSSTQSTVDHRRISKLREEYRVCSSVIVEDDETFDDRELGTLKVRRAERANVDDVLMANGADLDVWETASDEHAIAAVSEEEDEEGEFESTRSVRNLSIEVSEQLIERSATAFSTNEMVVGRRNSCKMDTEGTVRRLAMDKSLYVKCLTCIIVCVLVWLQASSDEAHH